ncbi:unnamed protein product [Gongylonema pulchrum]|uniref:C3H1-type domain-containing protein n=1 Tax=Gongylonema pulchrum TaxID=637853 RepID=A0A183DWC8_9BILA|nr:unnamed protein product [Gongylonema pulchrum]
MDTVNQEITEKSVVYVSFASNVVLRQVILERRRSSAYKTSLCNAFRDTGECSYGLQCRFAHGIGELRPAPEPHPKYKTQLCNKYVLYGSCPYGFRCQFIHMHPREMQDNSYRAQTNFSSSLDGRSNDVFGYLHHSQSGKASLGNSARGYEAPASPYDTFAQRRIATAALGDLRGPTAVSSSEAFRLQNPGSDIKTGRKTEQCHQRTNILQLANSVSANSPDVSAVDDMLSTL